jgi:hypothetical protein
MSLTLPSPRINITSASAPRSNWDQFLKLMIQFKQREGHCNVPIQHVESGEKLWIWLMVQKIDVKRERMDDDRRLLLEALGVDWHPLVRSLDFIWDFKLLLVLQFKQREGHLTVPVVHVEDGQALGDWINTHRKKQKAGTLGAERERRLNEIGFIWNGVNDGKWESMFKALKHFKQREGHLQVSAKHIETMNGGVEVKLGDWVKDQRYHKRIGTVMFERERRLTEVGFIWNGEPGCSAPRIITTPDGIQILTLPHLPSRSISAAAPTPPPISPVNPYQSSSDWDQFFKLMVQFKKREGHCKVPNHHVESGAKLWVWLMVQKINAKKRGTMTRLRRQSLESLGVDWSPKVSVLDFIWEFHFLLLVKFIEREGHLKVPTRLVEDGQKLGAWIRTNRRHHIRGRLCPERARRLHETGFIWYDGPYMNVSSEKETIENKDGGVKRKRESGTKNQPESSDDEHFDQNFDLLVMFNEREGHVLVPMEHQESANDNLGSWLVNQRFLHRTGALQLDRQKWLEVAGVTWHTDTTAE